MPRSRPFSQVDVFSSRPYSGNPLAVFLDAEDITTEQMQQIARWTNLSETTFVLAPTAQEADYRVRIFTPGGEIPFAGHPTLGTTHAWLEHGGRPRTPGTIVQECEAGLISVRKTGGGWAFAAPPTRRDGELDDEFIADIVASFGITRDQVIAHQWVDNGPGWAVVELPAAGDVLALEPDLSVIPDAKIGVLGAYPHGSDYDFEVRAFAPGVGVAEDPVTGSLNASIGQWLARTGRVDGGYRVSQGTRLGRSGEVAVTVSDGDVWVGGATHTLLTGTALV